MLAPHLAGYAALTQQQQQQQQQLHAGVKARLFDDGLVNLSALSNGDLSRSHSQSSPVLLLLPNAAAAAEQAAAADI